MGMPPPLVRSNATAPTRKDLGAEGETLIRQVLTAYDNLPFKGPRLVLPGDVVVSEDLWYSALETELSELADDGLERLGEFNLESWLVDKVRSEGTRQQQDELRILRQRLDEAESLDY